MKKDAPRGKGSSLRRFIDRDDGNRMVKKGMSGKNKNQKGKGRG